MKEADSTLKSEASPTTIDYSLVYSVPGYGKPIDYLPDKADPLYIGKELPSALEKVDMEDGLAASVQ